MQLLKNGFMFVSFVAIAICSFHVSAGLLDDLESSLQKAKELEKLIKIPAPENTGVYQEAKIPSLMSWDNDALKPEANSAILYTFPDCGSCADVRSYLSKRGVQFTEIDISKDASAQTTIAQLGTSSFPVLLSQAQRLDGFSPTVIKHFLQDFELSPMPAIPVATKTTPPDNSKMKAADQEKSNEWNPTLNDNPFNQDDDKRKVFYGYYYEHPDNLTSDPTSGVLILILDEPKGKFDATFQFSYEGCDGEVDVGKVTGYYTGINIHGNWKGNVDGVDVGGRFAGTLRENLTRVEGRYFNGMHTGDKLIDYSEDCQYTVSKKGQWFASTNGMSKQYIQVIDYGDEFKLTWDSFDKLFSIWIYDDECIRTGALITDCLMWANELNEDRHFVYGEGGITAKPLVNNKKYHIISISHSADLESNDYLTRNFVYLDEHLRVEVSPHIDIQYR